MQLFEIKIIKHIHKSAGRKYNLSMRKFILTALLAVLALVPLSGCKKKINYADYISEKRTAVYIYEGDDISVKIHFTEREQPYAADGIKGKLGPVCEVFVKLPKTSEEVNVSLLGHSGEMNYSATDGDYRLTFTQTEPETDYADVELGYDGKTESFRTLSVKYKGVLSCEQALGCVIEHDKKLFDALTSGNKFNAEIFVRLLSDDGCYYYVGVCDRDGNIKAFLVDGEKGKIIATKELNA